jgi:hypothetical protein
VFLKRISSNLNLIQYLNKKIKKRAGLGYIEKAIYNAKNIAEQSRYYLS